jgi:hypothetical protein
MNFEKTALRYINIGSEVFFVSNNEVLKGKVMNVTLGLDRMFKNNKYSLEVDDIYKFNNIKEENIYFSEKSAESSILDKTIFELGQRPDYSFIEIVNLPLGKSVIFKLGDILSQGIIGTDSYIIINDTDTLDVTYGVDLIHKKDVCCFCSILDIVF